MRTIRVFWLRNLCINNRLVFSQTSQIHKKDSHIKGQQRYVPHKRMNNAFMMHASTSPFYPLFAALDINAKMHEGVSGRNMWMDCGKWH